MIFLTLDQICEINRQWIARYGGRYLEADKNLQNRASLEYILEAIQYPIFGVVLFPSLIDKAAALAWWIIQGHIFNDGNKRTGMESAIELLEINGVTTYFDIDSVVEIPLAVAKGNVSVGELAQLVSLYIEPGSST